MCLPPALELSVQRGLAVFDDDDDDDIFGGDDYANLTLPCSDFPSSRRHGKRRRVRFEPVIEALLIKTLDEMTEEERGAVWYMPEEYQSHKKDAKNTVRFFLLLQRDRSLSSDGDNDSTSAQRAKRRAALEKRLCSRGLEHMLSASVMRERRTAKQAVVDAVLTEQEAQLNESVDSFGASWSDDDNASSLCWTVWLLRRPLDADRIAFASRMRSEAARRWAAERAALDAKEADAIRAADRAAMFALPWCFTERMEEDTSKDGNEGMEGTSGGGSRNGRISDLRKSPAIANGTLLQECARGSGCSAAVKKLTMPRQTAAAGESSSSNSHVPSLDDEQRLPASLSPIPASNSTPLASTDAAAAGTSMRTKHEDSARLLRSALSLLAKTK